MKRTLGWRRPFLVLGAVLATLTPVAAVADAHAGISAHRAAKPTIVLVHGAFAESSSWNTEVAALQGLGYPVVAASDPLRSLSGDADYVRSILQTISGPIVLVGHSYGGAVITNAARGVPNVKALVYVGAFVPAQGESIATVLDPTKYPGSLLGPSTTLVRPLPGGHDVDIYIKNTDFRAVFAGDVSASKAAVLAATQRPLSYTAETEE